MHNTGSSSLLGLLPRRDFLKLGSAAVIGAAATAIAPRALRFAADPQNDPLLGIGWVAAAPAENGASVALGDARRLMFGDSRFAARAARLAIGPSAEHVFTENAGSGNALEIVYPTDARFHAWSHMSHYVSPRVNLVVPVTSDGLQFAVSRFAPAPEKGAPAVRAESLLALRVGSESGAPKLKKGVYVVAFREKADEKVDWSRCALARNSTGNLVVSGASFPHAIMTVDYA